MSADEYKEIHRFPDRLLEFLSSLERKAQDLCRTDKSKLIANLLEDLDTKPDQGEWSEELTAKALEVLKLLGRETDITGTLFSSEGIRILMKRAGFLEREKPLDTPTSHEALKCLSNCILLQSATKELIVGRNGVEACFQLLSIPNLSMESQFLACRILFFLTVNNHELTGKLIHLDIAPVLQKVLSDNVSKLVKLKGKVDTRSAINRNSVVSEALKLLFNLMLVEIRGQGTEDPEKHRSVSEYFSKCLYPIYDYIFNVPLSEPLPLVPPLTHAINAFMQYTYEISVRMWRSCSEVAPLRPSIHEGRVAVASRAITVLDKSVSYLIPNGDEPNPEAANINIDATLSPLILTMRTAAASEEGYLKLYRERLLPNAEDRKKPVHQGDTLPARLIRLMTSAMVPQTRETVCELFFVLCHEDASEFTQEVGYGNAIGFLVNRGIPVEPPQGNDPSNPDKDINPITGQYLASEQEDLPKLSEMTDEEKEREAERLFVLFERLKKTGVVDVENPVVKAMRENPERFQELDSDSDKDSDD